MGNIRGKVDERVRILDGSREPPSDTCLENLAVDALRGLDVPPCKQ